MPGNVTHEQTNKQYESWVEIMNPESKTDAIREMKLVQWGNYLQINKVNDRWKILMEMTCKDECGEDAAESAEIICLMETHGK